MVKNEPGLGIWVRIFWHLKFGLRSPEAPPPSSLVCRHLPVRTSCCLACYIFISLFARPFHSWFHSVSGTFHFHFIISFLFQSLPGEFHFSFHSMPGVFHFHFINCLAISFLISFHAWCLSFSFHYFCGSFHFHFIPLRQAWASHFIISVGNNEMPLQANSLSHMI